MKPVRYWDHRDITEYVPTEIGLQEACGIQWNTDDVLRFLTKIKLVPNSKKPGTLHAIWTGGRSRGRGNTAWYGSFWCRGKTIRAHKFSGVAILGLRPVKDLDHLDHVCEDALCVSCLECVPVIVNLKRRWGREENY